MLRANGFWIQHICIGAVVTRPPPFIDWFGQHPYSNGLVSLKGKKKKSCAVLVDAENTPYHSLHFILHRLNDMGYKPLLRKAYADWSKSHLKGYNDLTETLSFTKVDSPTLVSGKGTSDAAMIVGAMCILQEHTDIECFAIVTSDSDFTPLVCHLKKAGKETVGFGRQQTPKALVKKFKEFVFLDDDKAFRGLVPRPMENQEQIQFLSNLIIHKANAEGWARLAELGNEFDYRQYGYKKMSQYFDANPDHFELNCSREFVRRILSDQSNQEVRP